MQHLSACRHINLTACPDVSEIRPVSGASRHAFALVHDVAAQEVDATASRQLRREVDFLAAVRFMVEAGFHPHAGRTTLRLAEVFATRMARSKDGHVPFSAEATARMLGLKRRAVFNHARYLRELGLIAYVEHGTKRNVLRARHCANWTKEHGYRATATLFAAVAPRVWDEAMGRRIRGHGYKARMTGVTPSGRILAVATALEHRRERADGQQRHPVDNSRPCTPSVEVPQLHTTVAVDGGIKDRTREHACREKKHRQRRGRGSTHWSATRTAAAMQEARSVRLHTWWTQGSCVRQLAYALRPCFEAGWTWEEIAREIARWTVPLRPRHVASYVASEIRRRVNAGELHLPDGLVAPYRQPETSTWDDDANPHGPRYAAMQAFKARTYRPAAARAAAALTETRRLVTRQRQPAQERPAQESRIPGAHPENVLLTRQEFASLVENSLPVLAGETLWAQTDEAAEYRLDAECRRGTWEYNPPLWSGYESSAGKLTDRHSVTIS
ncbi:hypothetical protein [Streptomyces chartreusis]|uniref:Helix-turn-helix domain-containing protein n=1 Tax=Streptomyces chartreusis TaxID=1969 RepID=A0A7H8TKZ9_STRCX|nr:hypothetical protein [Streptomyces chartreusis]QKZ23917.1 hypothetical protein HUT05_45140 [Streptomyces chartreusis]